MKLHKWTPNQIANMTPFQQLYACGIDPDSGTQGAIHFETMEEYKQWLTTRSKLT